MNKPIKKVVMMDKICSNCHHATKVNCDDIEGLRDYDPHRCKESSPQVVEFDAFGVYPLVVGNEPGCGRFKEKTDE